jgi:hypothetical protein
VRICVYGDDGTETDITEAVQVAYDVAVGSMDYGSGFLSTEEVGYLRAVGRAIGAEDVPYQHDKCGNCGDDRERHKDGVCYTDKDGNWGYDNPATSGHRQRTCTCTGFVL